MENLAAVSDTYYRNHIRNNEGMAPIMPLVHICDCYAFREILSSSFIKPADCPVFEEKLSYFFYGRPSYRLKDGGLTFSTVSVFPVCFIVEPSRVVDVKRVFPFDTGAFSNGLYANYIHESAKRDDYIFEPSYEFIQKYVHMFYGANVNYYDGDVTIEEKDMPVMAFEFQSLLQLVSQRCGQAVDERSYTVEVQTSGDTSILNGSVKAIVLPETIMNDEAVAYFMYEHDIYPITYHSVRAAPSHITPLIIDKVRDYYKKEGVI